MTDQDTGATVTWWEIPATDLEVSARFYEAVFGWTTSPFGEGYLAISRGAEMIGGLFAAEPGSFGDGAILTVDVTALEATLARIEGEGGTVVRGRTEIGGDMGWYAQFRDPSGLKLGLSTSNPA